MSGHLPPCRKRLCYRDAVGVFQIAADRQATRDTRYRKTIGCKLSLDVQRRCLPLETRICGDDHLANPTLRHTVYQPIDREVLGPDAVERRKSASENMIQASELTGALDRADIRRFFDCADERRVTTLIAANRTQLLFSEIETALTGADALSQRHERSREPLTVLSRLTQEVIRQTKRRLPTDARKTRELGGEILYRGQNREPGTGNGEPYLRGASVPGSPFPVPGFTTVSLRMGA